MSESELYLVASIILNLTLVLLLFHQKKLRARLLLSALKQTACFADTVLQLRRVIENNRQMESAMDIASLQKKHNAMYDSTDNDFFAEPIEDLAQFVESLSKVVDKHHSQLNVRWTKI